MIKLTFKENSKGKFVLKIIFHFVQLLNHIYFDYFY